MFKLLLYMNFMGALFYVLHLFFLPFEEKSVPPNYRIFTYRINLIFFIIPFPVFLFYFRRYFDNFGMEIPVSPFYYNGSHIVVHLGQNVSFVLPKLNYFQIIFILLWIVVMTIKYIRFAAKNRKLRAFNSSLSLFQTEEMAASSINVTKLVETALKELDIKKKPRVFLQESLPVPHVSGVFRITLCLPCHWNVSEQVYYMAIKHELAHVRHKDLLFQRIALIARIISWFNPFLYLLCSSMDACEELAADARACDGASREDRTAYQSAILDLAAITFDNPHMPVKRFGITRIRKNITKVRILTMNNKNLYKHKKIKLVTTALITAILFSLATIPSLAYNVPPALEIENQIASPIDIYNFKFIPDSMSESIYILPTEDDLNYLFKNVDYTEGNFISIDENGILSNDTRDSLNTFCNHNYCLTAQTSNHDINLDGSCTITYYNAKKCSKCEHIIIQDLIATMSYDQCPHSSDTNETH